MQTAAMFAGVDGCPGGWIAVIGEGGGLRAEVFGSFAVLAASLPDKAIIAVDVADRSARKGRAFGGAGRAGASR
jgi:predicted RNase H-like nuclease